MTEKPTINDVLAYAEIQIAYFLRKYASTCPEEQKEEMAQDCRMRIYQAYEKLENEKGWKAFVQQHVFGAIQDYKRRGRGFEESKWSLAEERDGSEPMRFREAGPPDSEEMDVDKVIGLKTEPEVYTEEMPAELNIRWDLLARLCSKDPDLHIFVRHYLKGQTLTELTGLFGITRERIGQRLQAFILLFDDPMQVDNPWMNQIIYALDLCKYFSMTEIDQGVGWHFDPVDFSGIENKKSIKIDQLSFFDLKKDLQ